MFLGELWEKLKQLPYKLYNYFGAILVHLKVGFDLFQLGLFLSCHMSQTALCETSTHTLRKRFLCRKWKWGWWGVDGGWVGEWVSGGGGGEGHLPGGLFTLWGLWWSRAWKTLPTRTRAEDLQWALRLVCGQSDQSGCLKVTFSIKKKQSTHRHWISVWSSLHCVQHQPMLWFDNREQT